MKALITALIGSLFSIITASDVAIGLFTARGDDLELLGYLLTWLLLSSSAVTRGSFCTISSTKDRTL